MQRSLKMPKKGSKDLTNEQKNAMVVQSQYNNHAKLMEMFRVSKSTVKRILRLGREQLAAGAQQIAAGAQVPSFVSPKKGKSGRKIGLTDEMKTRIQALNFFHKGELSVRAFAREYFIAHGTLMTKTTVASYFKVMNSSLRSSYAKPLLTNEHKARRIEFVIGNMIHNGHGSYEFGHANKRTAHHYSAGWGGTSHRSWYC